MATAFARVGVLRTTPGARQGHQHHILYLVTIITVFTHYFWANLGPRFRISDGSLYLIHNYFHVLSFPFIMSSTWKTSPRIWQIRVYNYRLHIPKKCINWRSGIDASDLP